jgi:peptide deformylase
MPVVAFDQLVDLGEVPTFRLSLPLSSEPLGVTAALVAQRQPGVRQLRLVQPNRDLDRAKPAHPRDRAAQCGQLRGGVRAEVAQPPAKRRTRERISLEVLLERVALGSVPWRLRTGHALPHDRLTLTPFHAASVPAVTEVEGQVRNEELDAEREARRQLALAQIRQYPDPVLRMEARPVEEFDDELRRLVGRMGQLMKEANGAGLAATQIGVLRRVFVFSPEEDEVLALVNPEIVSRSDEVDTDDEGCLSLQGVTAPVARALSVRIEGRDEAGQEVAYDLEGTPARIVQHELDHLDGKLMIDRTTPEARRAAMAALRPRVVIR